MYDPYESCPYTIIKCPEFDAPDDAYRPPIDFKHTDGIADAKKRHDALARKRYVKPFKWFKFNRARKATAK